MKFRSTKVDTGDFKHELLNRLRSTMAVNVLIFNRIKRFWISEMKGICICMYVCMYVSVCVCVCVCVCVYM